MFARVIGSNLLVSHLGQTDLLIKLYARVIVPAGKVKTTNLFAENKRDYVTETVRNVCLNKNDVLHKLHISRLCFPTLSPRQFEVSRLVTLHSRQGENNPIYI